VTKIAVQHIALARFLKRAGSSGTVASLAREISSKCSKFNVISFVKKAISSLHKRFGFVRRVLKKRKIPKKTTNKVLGKFKINLIKGLLAGCVVVRRNKRVAGRLRSSLRKTRKSKKSSRKLKRAIKKLHKKLGKSKKSKKSKNKKSKAKKSVLKKKVKITFKPKPKKSKKER